MYVLGRADISIGAGPLPVFARSILSPEQLKQLREELESEPTEARIRTSEGAGVMSGEGSPVQRRGELEGSRGLRGSGYRGNRELENGAYLYLVYQ